MREIFVIAICILFLIYCNSPESTAVWPDKNPRIEVIKINSKESLNINTSEIFDKAQFIKLESNEDNLMGDIVKLIVADNHYYILCSNGLFIFNEDGSYINKISRTTTNEIRSFTDFHVDTVRNTITIYDNKGRQFVETDMHGKTIDNWFVDLDGYSSQRINDDLFAIYIGASYYNKRANHKLNFVNKKGEIVFKCFPINEHETSFMHFGDLNNFSSNNSSIKFLYSFNDTIYAIKERKIIPELCFDFGSEKVPLSILSSHYKDVMHFYETLKSTNYSFRINGLVEGDQHLIFSYANGLKIVHGVFSKKSKSLKLINQYIDDLSFDGSEITPNFLNLPRSHYHSEYYSFIDSHDFIQRVESIKQKESWLSFSKRHPDITQIFQETTVRDNPIIFRFQMKDF
ncbi:MAG: 6-bladed beta-propeller [Cyclobacteriaceae bacterium]|nr:6-bladed beta-propeller [Cyclobacteriaceae bacterium]